MKDFDVNEKVEIVRQMLIGVAKFDGNVTDEEMRLIDRIAVDVNAYFQKLAEINAKSEPSKYDRADLFKLKLNIISKAVKSIREDMRVTPDEKELFQAIQELLPGLPS